MESRKRKTYYCILCEVSGYPYKADENTKQLAIALRKYLLETINAQCKSGEVKDPIWGCSRFQIHGHNLSWNSNNWEESAKVLYTYFKAERLVQKIKEYELIYRETIINDYFGTIEYLYKSLTLHNEIDYWGIPSLGASFEYVPIEALNSVLEKFENLYE